MKKLFYLIKKYPTIQLFFIYFTIIIGVSVLIFYIEGAVNDKIENLFDAVWLSIISMTTTGFGDIVPITTNGKILSILTVLLGIMMISLFTGTLTSIYINRISRKRSGHMKYKSIKDHLVICGWRENMHSFLFNILQEGLFSADKIVIIANMPQLEVDSLFEHEELDNIKFVRGESYDTNVLLKANVKFAKKAMVLSERKEGGVGFDVDSRSVMTVIALKTMNKNIYVCAQLLEKEFDVYLQKANCDEIIYSRDLNTEILSKSVSSDGMGNVLHELLGYSKSGCSINIEKIKQQYIDKNYKELKLHYEKVCPHDVILGVVENTGKKKEVNDQAIREAQKTANFIQMLYDLKKVTSLRPYKPIILPNDNYIILDNSSIIILRKKYDQ